MDISRIILEINVSDYDKIPDLVDTKLFNILDDIEFIGSEHSFIHFMKGFTVLYDSELCKNILHGWYHKETGTSKFLVKYPNETGNILTHTWKLFIGCEKTDVYVYGRYCGSIYESNEFDVDEKYFYKTMIKNIVDKLVNDSE